jgi:hypothetical protein
MTIIKRRVINKYILDGQEDEQKIDTEEND